MIIRLKGEDVIKVRKKGFILIDSSSDLMNRKDWNMNLGNLLLVIGLVDLLDTIVPQLSKCLKFEAVLGVLN